MSKNKCNLEKCCCPVLETIKENEEKRKTSIEESKNNKALHQIFMFLFSAILIITSIIVSLVMILVCFALHVQSFALNFDNLFILSFLIDAWLYYVFIFASDFLDYCEELPYASINTAKLFGFFTSSYGKAYNFLFIVIVVPFALAVFFSLVSVI